MRNESLWRFEKSERKEAAGRLRVENPVVFAFADVDPMLELTSSPAAGIIKKNNNFITAL